MKCYDSGNTVKDDIKFIVACYMRICMLVCIHTYIYLYTHSNIQGKDLSVNVELYTNFRNLKHIYNINRHLQDSTFILVEYAI